MVTQNKASKAAPTASADLAEKRAKAIQRGIKSLIANGEAVGMTDEQRVTLQRASIVCGEIDLAAQKSRLGA